jgi:hypothetical protein
MPEKFRAPEAPNFPDKNWQIPLTGEQFNPHPNLRQLTLSYQLLPLKRRKAAQNATATRSYLPEMPSIATEMTTPGVARRLRTKRKETDISDTYEKYGI